MSKFLNTVDIFGKEIQYSELLVKDYKIILKSLFGDVPNPKIIFLNLRNILQERVELSAQDLDELDFIDFFILLFNLRSISLGNVLNLTLTQNDMPTKITLDINKIISKFEDVKKSFIQTKYIQAGDFEIELRLPTIFELLSYLNLTDIGLDGIIFIKFIKSSKFKTLNLEINKNLSIEERSAIFSKLPVIVTTKLLKTTQQQILNIKSVNILDILNNKMISDTYNIPIDVNVYNLSFLVKILFLDDLLSLYDNIYNLSKNVNMSAEYVENCTPGEFQIFVKRLEMSIQKENSNQESSNIGEQTAINDDSYVDL